jgi:hypothetical protein
VSLIVNNEMEVPAGEPLPTQWTLQRLSGRNYNLRVHTRLVPGFLQTCVDSEPLELFERLGAKFIGPGREQHLDIRVARERFGEHPGTQGFSRTRA